MKIKIACRPRYNPWVKNISRILAFGILLNSIPINSFARTLSENGRYETFEGSDITINNILEEDKVDVEIEGNTLVNHIDYSKLISSNGVTINGNEIYFSNYINHIDLDNPNSTDVFIKAKADLQVGEIYTVIFNIANNDIKGEQFLSVINTWENNYSNEIAKISSQEVGLIKLKFTAENTTNGELDIRLRNFKTQNVNGIIKIKDLMILNGDWTNKDIPQYFNGMKSVGENTSISNQINIQSRNKKENLYTKDTPIGGDAISVQKTATGFKFKGSKELSTIRIWDVVDKRDTYSVSGYIKSNSTSPVDFGIDICDSFSKMYYNLTNEWIRFEIEGATLTSEKIGVSPYTFVDITIPGNNNIVYEVKELKIEKSSTITPYYLSKYNITNDTYNDNILILNEPLRGLPNGVKDRIIKRNGQWVIERNCGGVIFDGSNDENWFIPGAQTGGNSILFRCRDKTDNKRVNGLYYPNLIVNKLTILTPREAFGWDGNGNLEGVSTGTEYLDGFDIRISKSKLNSVDVNGFKEWLSNNNIKIVYELEKSYYEPLNTSSNIYLYVDTTLISSDSIIPANLKVTVDRTLNRAVEAIELAKINPTIENLSKARYWNNLLKDSIKKDQLQEEINNITNISDMELEKKTATSNLDVYIKSENILQMSLDTNSISFENFSGIEDVVKENAVNISINSSLPYQMNAYLPSEIQNSDKSVAMDKSILNIKENTESNYQTFTNTTDKIVLKDNCPAGNDLVHDIDIKLKGGIAHQKDVYKTTIKFEAQQK